LLQEQFPNLQFIVATHSPLIASGAGENALTLKFAMYEDKAIIEKVSGISALSVDYVLRSPAFGLVSSYSPITQRKIDQYDSLLSKMDNLDKDEKKRFRQLQLFIQETRPFGGPPAPGSLEAKVDDYLEKHLK
jgi:predicted ATP-binding protein involved in virulence